MKLFDPPFKLCEEVLQILNHFLRRSDEVDEEKINRTVGKNAVYVKRAFDYLIQINAIIKLGNRILLNKDGIESNSSKSNPTTIIKKRLANFDPFKEYIKLIHEGKSEKTALKLTIETYNIENELEKTRKIFDKSLKYLTAEILIKSEEQYKIANIQSENFFWTDPNGHFVYDEDLHLKQLTSLGKSRFNNSIFVDKTRIESLNEIRSPLFDLSKLVKLAEELNDAHRLENYFSVGVLVRAILDHIPPIFKKKSFGEVANNHGSKSFKDVMLNLDNFSRKIADGILHSHIKRKESLPNAITVDCKHGLDVLIGEIINELS